MLLKYTTINTIKIVICQCFRVYISAISFIFNPVISAIILSLESVFSVLAGVLILKEHLSSYEMIGCAIMFIAILFSQLPFGRKEEA